MTGIVTPSNLGTDFDIGGQVASKINIVPATSTSAGKVRFATAAEAGAGAANVAVDAANAAAMVAAAHLDMGADSNTATNGVFGLGANIVAATDFGQVGAVVTQITDWGLFDGTAPATIIDLGSFP